MSHSLCYNLAYIWFNAVIVGIFIFAAYYYLDSSLTLLTKLSWSRQWQCKYLKYLTSSFPLLYFFDRRFLRNLCKPWPPLDHGSSVRAMRDEPMELFAFRPEYGFLYIFGAIWSWFLVCEPRYESDWRAKYVCRHTLHDVWWTYGQKSTVSLKYSLPI